MAGSTPGRERGWLHTLGPALLLPVSLLALFLVLATNELDHQTAFWRPPAHAAPWPGLSWLSYPGGSEVLYLRSDVVRTSDSGTVLARVSGTEAYELYVNGQQLGAGQFEGAYARGVFDITARLEPGQNVVALRVASSGIDVFAQGAVEIECVGGTCPAGAPSLGPWRALDHEQLATRAHAAWSSVDYDDQAWPLAVSGPAQALPATAAPLPLHALVGLHGSWIWSDDLAARDVVLRRTLDISDRWISGAWLGVATSGDYRIAINGSVFDVQSGSLTGLSLFDVAPYLRPGANEITVWASVDAPPRRAAITGVVAGADGPWSFSSDGDWQVAPDGGAVTALGDARAAPPALVGAPLASPPGHRLARVWGHLGRGLLACLVAAIGALSFVRASARRGVEPAKALVLFCAPFALADLLLFDLAMLRSDPSLAVGPGVAALAACAVVLVLFLWWRSALGGAPRAVAEAEVRS